MKRKNKSNFLMSVTGILNSQMPYQEEMELNPWTTPSSCPRAGLSAGRSDGSMGKVLACEPEDRSVIPGIHMWKERRISQRLSSDIISMP